MREKRREEKRRNEREGKGWIEKIEEERNGGREGEI